jgi:hypothetical protein
MKIDKQLGTVTLTMSLAEAEALRAEMESSWGLHKRHGQPLGAYQLEVWKMTARVVGRKW